MKPLTGIQRPVPAARREPAMTTGNSTACGLVAVPRTADLPPAPVAGLWSPVSAGEVDAIADLLRHPPAQHRSVQRVAAILDIAAQTSRDPELTTTTLAARCGMSIGSVYQYFGDFNMVLACVGAVWMRRTITATVRAVATGEASTPDQLASLLISHLAAYRSRYRPPASSGAAIRDRAEREHAWHRQLAATLASLIIRPGAGETEDRETEDDGPETRRLVDARCLIAVTLADRAARAAVQAGIQTGAQTGVHAAARGDGRDLFATEMARMVVGAIQLAAHGRMITCR